MTPWGAIDEMANRILIAGLPESGKTTYLAALWHILQHSQHPSIRLARMPDDSAYLTSLSMLWLSCETVSHTTQETKRSTIISVETANGASQFDLELPDLSGESFSNGFELRSWETQISDLANTASGLALFVGPKISDVMLIDEAIEVASSISASSNNSSTAAPSSAPSEEANDAVPELKKWSASESPTQTYLVDILQQILRERPRFLPLKLSLIASAWDKWRGLSMTPETWLERTLPLLWQFLESNSGRFPLKVYGVSAQGGDYKEGGRVDQLTNMDPCERPLVISGTDTSNDLGIPLSWFFG